MSQDTQTVAITAIRALLATTPEAGPDEYFDRSHAASIAVTQALAEGVTHRQLASATGCPGLMLVDLIADDDARAVALLAEQHHADRYAASVRQATRSYAVRMHGCGRTKTDIAIALHISRPTLDAWLTKPRNEEIDMTATHTLLRRAECQGGVGDR